MDPQDITPEIDASVGGLPVGTELVSHSLLSEGALSRKLKALIAAACAMSGQCDQCAAEFSRHAFDWGVTREELLEAASLAQSMGYQIDPARHFHETTPVQTESPLSEWCWTQDDGCVLGNWE